MAKFVPPFSIEIHSDSGHVFLPSTYKEADVAVAIAEACQQKETDPSATFLVSDRNQDIIWEATHG
jgi:hypothetical protein